MGSPYESFGDDRVALIVDLEPTVVHEPRPGALDDPPSREHLEAMLVDLVHHLGGDVVCTAWGDEGLLEAPVTPDLLQSAGVVPRPLDGGDSSYVVRHVGGHDDHGHEESEGVDHTEGLAPGDLLSGVISPGGTGDCRCSSHASGIDDPGRRLCVTTFAFSHLVPQSLADPLPDSVLRPANVVAVHSVPVGVVRRQRSPLATRRRHVEDGVHDVALVPLGGASHATVPRVGGDQISDQIPFLIGQITLGRSPGRHNGFVLGSHQSSLWPPHTRRGTIQPLCWYNFDDSLSDQRSIPGRQRPRWSPRSRRWIDPAPPVWAPATWNSTSIVRDT